MENKNEIEVWYLAHKRFYIEQMWAMSVIIRSLNDEDCYERWTGLIPDGIETYLDFDAEYGWWSLSEVSDFYEDVEATFASIMKSALKEKRWCALPRLAELQQQRRKLVEADENLEPKEDQL